MNGRLEISGGVREGKDGDTLSKKEGHAIEVDLLPATAEPRTMTRDCVFEHGTNDRPLPRGDVPTRA